MARVPPLTLRRINNALTAIVVVFASYIILAPFIPSFSWWAQHEAPLISKPPSVAAVQAVPAENTLILPSIGLSEVVHDGPTKYTLRQGVWHRPASSSPDKGSNTVLAGHRFTYHDPAVFYHLDKVSVGDAMILYWHQKKYSYKIDKILTVPPTATEIEAPTNKPTLTVYTCTPLWSSKYRLALIGTLEDI